jgi:hypothetical protein
MDWLDDTVARLPSSTMGNGPLMEEVIVGMKGLSALWTSEACEWNVSGRGARWLVTQRIFFWASARK